MTNDIHEVRFDSIIMNLKAVSPKDILKKLSEHTSNLIGTSQQTIYDSLMEQEKQDCSGIGGGIAIPHMRLPSLTKPFIIFAKLDKAIEFNAVDHDPVDLVCLVLSPEFEGPKHLSRLSTVSRFFSNQVFCEKLRHATDADDIRLIIREINDRKMAA